MNKTIIGFWYSVCTYKKAICKGSCYNKLEEGSKILSISRAQGKFNSVSNYCAKCATEELILIAESLSSQLYQVVNIQTQIEKDAKLVTQVKN